MQKKFRDMKGGSPNERMIGRMASSIVYVQEGSTDGILAVANATHEIQSVLYENGSNQSMVHFLQVGERSLSLCWPYII